MTGKAGQKVTPTSSVEDTLSEELEVNNPNGDINIEGKSSFKVKPTHTQQMQTKQRLKMTNQTLS